MWTKHYKDYPEDTPLKKEIVEPGKGLIGCEMHDLNGWGNTLHYDAHERKTGWLKRMLKEKWEKKQ